MNNKRLTISLLIGVFVVLGLYVAVATHTVTWTGTTNKTDVTGTTTSNWVSGGEVAMLNFTINKTNDNQDNITYINITIPSGFIYVNDSARITGNATTGAPWFLSNWSVTGDAYIAVVTFNVTNLGLGGAGLGYAVPTNVSIDVEASSPGTEATVTFSILTEDNSTGTITTTVTNLGIDDLGPTYSNVNASDGVGNVRTALVPTGDDDLNDSIITIRATITDNTLNTTNATLYYNISTSVQVPMMDRAQYTVIMTGPNQGNTTGVFNATILDEQANDTHIVSFMIVTSDILGHSSNSSVYNFTIDSTRPTASSGSPTGTVTTASPTIGVVSSDKGTCKYNIDADASYNSMSGTFTADAAGTTHNKTLSGLSDQEHTVYVRCMDTAQNIATSSYSYSFLVLVKRSGSPTGGGGSILRSYSVDFSKADEGSVSGRKGAVKSFSLDGKIKHTIKFDEVGEDSVTLTIQSDPQEVTLKVGESEEIEVGEGTFTIELTKIEDGKAYLDFEKVSVVGEEAEEEAAEEEEAPSEGEEAPPTTTAGEEGGTPAWVWIVVVVIIVVVVVLLYFFVFSKKK